MRADDGLSLGAETGVARAALPRIKQDIYASAFLPRDGHQPFSHQLANVLLDGRDAAAQPLGQRLLRWPAAVMLACIFAQERIQNS
ncbi:hypothetical protein [uncultured Desulfovibrio sp.]|uniref:hypothetical protein n=1 Tax=uncultured Desulfovibrio sp. TaxID=167968 RepID=UPI0025FDA26B|nr:hypothetical protein [uncultured Desulfovibrio sp.]